MLKHALISNFLNSISKQSSIGLSQCNYDMKGRHNCFTSSHHWPMDIMRSKLLRITIVLIFQILFENIHLPICRQRHFRVPLPFLSPLFYAPIFVWQIGNIFQKSTFLYWSGTPAPRQVVEIFVNKEKGGEYNIREIGLKVSVTLTITEIIECFVILLRDRVSNGARRSFWICGT